jgi:hypothetical protein
MSRRKKPKSKGPQQGHSPQPSQGARNQATPQSGSHNAEPRVIQAENPQLQKGQIAIQSVMTPRRHIHKKQMHQRNVGAPTKKYGLIFYETLQAARNDTVALKELSSQYDQLNIVVRAEVTVETPELLPFGKVFTGAAWALIHERRKQDGWYDESHE